MKVLVAMSGGVDSSVAAALLRDGGHGVVGVTMRLWGGSTDTGCCSVADVDDARRVAQQLGIDHLVFNFTADFDTHVVEPYVTAHRAARTPNPCIECNRHLKFARLAERADLLGFDAVATGHHARILRDPAGRLAVARGVDRLKDQSYVVHMVSGRDLDRTLFPVGDMTKAEVRDVAARLGLRTADKPDSQDVCFITTTGGRATFLGDRIPFRPARVVDTSGQELGVAPAIELVTVGQRKGLGLPGGGPKRYVVDVDAASATVVVGGPAEVVRATQPIDGLVLADAGRDADAARDGGVLLAQCSAHGEPQPATIDADGALRWREPQRRVAPGQSIVFYDTSDTFVLGAAFAA